MPDQLDRLKAALSDRYAIKRELGRGGIRFQEVILPRVLLEGQKPGMRRRRGIPDSP